MNYVICYKEKLKINTMQIHIIYWSVNQMSFWMVWKIYSMTAIAMNESAWWQLDQDSAVDKNWKNGELSILIIFDH